MNTARLWLMLEKLRFQLYRFEKSFDLDLHSEKLIILLSEIEEIVNLQKFNRLHPKAKPILKSQVYAIFNCIFYSYLQNKCLHLTHSQIVGIFKVLKKVLEFIDNKDYKHKPFIVFKKVERSFKPRYVKVLILDFKQITRLVHKLNNSVYFFSFYNFNDFEFMYYVDPVVSNKREYFVPLTVTKLSMYFRKMV